MIDAFWIVFRNDILDRDQVPSLTLGVVRILNPCLRLKGINLPV